MLRHIQISTHSKIVLERVAGTCGWTHSKIVLERVAGNVWLNVWLWPENVWPEVDLLPSNPVSPTSPKTSEVCVTKLRKTFDIASVVMGVRT